MSRTSSSNNSSSGGGGAVARLRTAQSRAVQRGAGAGRRPGGAVIRSAGRRPQLRRSVPAPPSPVPGSHHGSGVGGRGPAEPLPGGLCGEPEQVPAEAGDLGR